MRAGTSGFFKDSLTEPCFEKGEVFLCLAWALWPASGCELCRAGCEETQHQAPVGTSESCCVYLPSSWGSRPGEEPSSIYTRTRCCCSLYNSSTTSPGGFALCMPWKQNASFCLPGEQTSAFAVPGSAVACHAPDLPSSGRQRATYRTLTGAYSENWRFKSRRSAETATYSFSHSSPGMLFLPAACRLPPLPLYHRWNLVRACS